MAPTRKTPTLLKEILADTYTLYLKTQNYHWNVTGPNFRSLHLMFEEQYTDLAAAVDTLAERLRSLGERAPGSFKEFLALTTIKEAKDKVNGAAMVKDLVDSNHAVIARLEKLLQAADKEGDEVTTDLMVQRLTVHQKAAWMLQATIG